MIRDEIVIPKNDIMVISEALKKIPEGGFQVTKKRGGGKSPTTGKKDD